MLWGPEGMTDSSVLVTSVGDAFPGFDDSTGQQPSLRGAVAREALAPFWQPHRCALSSSRDLDRLFPTCAPPS